MVEKEFRKAYKEWTGKDGLIHCPKCKSIKVAHIAVVHEGDLLICTNCKNQVKIGNEDQKVRKGFSL